MQTNCFVGSVCSALVLVVFACACSGVCMFDSVAGCVCVFKCQYIKLLGGLSITHCWLSQSSSIALILQITILNKVHAFAAGFF